MTDIREGMGGDRSKKLAKFVAEITNILDSGHKEYGETAEAIYKAIGPEAPGYAVAEKGIRYAKKGKKIDLVKAATYAFLAWSVAADAE